MKLGIVGLGYVGLPLALAFAEAGNEVVGIDTDAAKLADLGAGRSYIEDVDDAELQACGPRLHPSSDYADLEDCEAVILCVPTPLSNSPRARPLLPAGGRRGSRRPPAAGTADRPRVDVLSRHHPGGAPPGTLRTRRSRRRRLLPRLLAGADRSGPLGPHDPHHAEAGRWHHPRLHRARPGALRADLRHGRDPQLPRDGRAGKAPREHLPLRQHRSRQRNRPALRPPRHRRLGGGRRGGDQAVRLHALRPGPGNGRPLPPRRPLSTPRLQGARARLLPRVRRAGRQGQPGPAGVLRPPHRARPQRRRQAGQGLAHPDPRRQLQARHRRHPANPRPCGSSPSSAIWAPRSPTTTPSSPSSPPRTSARSTSRRPSPTPDLLAIVTAHPGVDHAAAIAAVPRAIDFRGIIPAGSTSRTSSASSGLSPARAGPWSIPRSPTAPSSARRALAGRSRRSPGRSCGSGRPSGGPDRG